MSPSASDRSTSLEEIANLLAEGDRLQREDQRDEALAHYLAASRITELPTSDVCVRIARLLARRGRAADACEWSLRTVDAGDDVTAWDAAARVLDATKDEAPEARRRVRLAVVGSHTTSFFTPLLRLALRRVGIATELYESGFDLYRQEILDPASGLYRFGPDVVVLAVHDGELAFPDLAADSTRAVADEAERWTSLWSMLLARTDTRIVQHGFVVPFEAPFGHLSRRLPGARDRLVAALNDALGTSAPAGVSFVDCDRLASTFGKERWLDQRQWHLAKQAVAMDALPVLARNTAAVVAADLGLSRKCLAFDLDNTIWGGVVGEDGLAGIQLGYGAAGEAHLQLQEQILRLKERGIVLAVCSKNDEAVAKEVFERHPEMRIGLDDIAVFLANWDSKVENLRRIAETLDIGLDAIVLLDDNPVERQEVRHRLPDVDVVPLPEQPSAYARTLAEYLGFEATALTEEDTRRTEQYRARALAKEAMSAAATVDDFLHDLAMSATVSRFTAQDLPRIAQLIGKTNQFNLTSRRHGLADLERMVADPQCVHLTWRLRDRFTDHGLVAVAIGFASGDTLEIDTLLMSCRVIGRTLERTMIDGLAQSARKLGCRSLWGVYLPSDRNAVVADLYERLGFAPVRQDAAAAWRLDLREAGDWTNEFITANWHA